ncbi:hypothetical protein [Bartonella mastomydis]|uniref:hypothetical protein n=1 Tax=Bartonella mastomydis TaxID=1820002 RepID=UPI0015D64278|nr:hypothetical protein [Bartonella mastomydis]
MEIDKCLELWRLLEKLTILQAALLIAGLNPITCTVIETPYPEDSVIYEDGNVVSRESTVVFHIAYNAIVQAGHSSRLIIEWVENSILGFINESSSYVLVEDLKRWLLLRGQRPAFFFPKNDFDNIKDHKYAFQDPNHPHYAPKLAAVVAAWEVVHEAAPNKSVKATLAEWLQENANQYDLRDKKSGKLKNDVIEQLASVANWDPTGGAPKTKASVSLSEKKETKKSDNSVCSASVNNSEIPF